MEAERPEPIERIDNRQFDELHNQELNEKIKMNTEKLTLQWCFKYPKAKIKALLTDYSELNIVDWIDKNYLMDIKDYILILRPSDSPLAESELAKINSFYKSVVNYLDLNEDVSFSKNCLDLIDYLRSINIDIDGLQKRGIAVYE